MILDPKAYAERLVEHFGIEVVAEALKADQIPKNLATWAEGTPVILDGERFSFKKHEYLKQIYEDPAPYEVHLKATQLGLTVYGTLRTLFSLRYLGFLGVLYLFPSRTDVADYSRSRVKTILDENRESIGRWVSDTDNISLKKVHQGHLYLRGMVSRVGLKSVRADLVVYDELDEARDQTAVDMAIERLAHSPFKEVLMLSNPSLPDFGISKAFDETNQQYWLIKCPGCRRWCNLVEDFPDCLIEASDGVYRGCVKCGHELDISSGRWVPKKPGVKDRVGYQHSQLHSHYVEPAELLRKYRSARTQTNFINLCLGLPHVEATNRLTVQEVLALCGDDRNASGSEAACFAGIDQGKDLHCVVGRRHDKGIKVVHIGIYKEWYELDQLMKRFNIVRCTVDAMPEMRAARSFAERFKGRVYLNFYNDSQRGGYRWDQKKMTVLSNRTESLDAASMAIRNGEVVLPAESPLVQEFAQHLHNSAKRLVEDEETGSKKYTYIKLGDDHFFHAFNYLMLCFDYGKDSVFKDLF